jgi:hypothetical protein
MRAKKLNILKAFAMFFLLLGVVGWFLPWAGRPFQFRTELPNSERHGLVLDSSGNIYCGSKFYGRIQKYYPDGRFARGYNSEGGTGWGSDFGFRINENGQLCITVSVISKDNKGSVHRTKIYDDKGNLIHTEKRESSERNYTHHMKDFAVDSFGNRYTFKGFLFPRIVKHTPSGQKSIIIGTPIWLWFLQGPFPAFGFFFISMLVLVFLSFKADAAKLSVPTINLMFNIQRLPSLKKFLLLVAGIIGIVVLLSIIIPIGFETYPMLVIFGFLSFAITMVIIMFLTLILVIIGLWRSAKLDSKTLKKTFSSSLRARYEASRSLRSLLDRDPFMQRIGKVSSKIAVTCLLIWFVVLVLATCLVLYLNHIGIWQKLINK